MLFWILWFIKCDLITVKRWTACWDGGKIPENMKPCVKWKTNSWWIGTVCVQKKQNEFLYLRPQIDLLTLMRQWLEDFREGKVSLRIFFWHFTFDLSTMDCLIFNPLIIWSLTFDLLTFLQWYLYAIDFSLDSLFADWWWIYQMLLIEQRS